MAAQHIGVEVAGEDQDREMSPMRPLGDIGKPLRLQERLSADERDALDIVALPDPFKHTDEITCLNHARLTDRLHVRIAAARAAAQAALHPERYAPPRPLRLCLRGHSGKVEIMPGLQAAHPQAKSKSKSTFLPLTKVSMRILLFSS